MSGLFAQKGKVPKTAPEVSSLRLTTSTYGRAIPLGWGRFKMAAWVLWYRDFKAIAKTESQSAGGKGGGGDIKTTSYTYETAIILGLTEGPINDVLRLWKGKELVTGAGTSSKTYRKKENFTVPANGIVVLDAPGTITAVTTLFTWGNYYDDVAPAFIEGTHWTRSGNTLTFTSGFGFSFQIEYSYTQTAAPNTPLGAAGLTLFKGTYPQSVWSYLTSNHPTEAIGYPGIAYVAAPAYQLGSDTSLPNTSLEVDSGFGYSSTIRDVNPKDFLSDFLTNPYYGANFTTQSMGDWSDYSTYCVAAGLFLSPDYTEQEPAAAILARTLAITNSDCVFADKKLEIVPYADLAVTGNGKTWTPNLVAAYELTDDDFLPMGDMGPISHKRKDPNERYNQIKIRFRNRDKEYNDDVHDAKDESEIGRNGLRPSPYDQDSPEIKDKNVAVNVGNILVQRSVNVCNGYVFRLPFRYAVVKPMALLTLTYAPMELSGQLVRVITIKEVNEIGDLEFEVEEVPVGAASSILYPVQLPFGASVDFNVPPGDVETPVIFEAPAQVTMTGLEVLAAVRGVDPNWGGFRAWVSLDGATYREVARVDGGSRYGNLTGAVSGGNLPVLIKGGQLLSGASADADALTTLCYIGGASKEFLSYTTATLTGTLAYTLSGLVRGAYGSVVNAHANNDPFVRVDGAVARSGPLDTSYIGKTVYFKFTSFNIYGGAEQSLADVTEYSYVVTGLGAQLLPGIGGKALRLKADALTFRVPASGPTEPASITLTAERKGLLTGTVTFSIQSGTATLAGSGDTRTIAASSMTTDRIVVRASITDAVATYFEDVSIIKVLDGVSGGGQFTMAVANASWDGSTLEKTAGGTGFNAQGYSLESFLSAAYVTFQAGQTNHRLFAGLNQDPTTDADWTGIDYGWEMQTSGQARVVESGSVVGSNVAYTTASVFAIISDGVDVRYYIDSNLHHTSAVDPAGKKLHFDSSLNIVGTILNNVRFGVTGGAGASAKAVALSATSQVFLVPKAGGAAVPSSITLNASGQNLSGAPTFTVTTGTATLTGTGNSRTLTFANLTTDSATIQVTWDGLTDTITIVKVREGEDSYNGFLTNESHVVQADSAGNVGSFAGSGGTFKMFRGITDITTGASVAYSVVSESGVDVSINASTGAYTVASMSADTGTATFRATIGAVTVDKVYSIAKSKAGAAGSGGAAGLNSAKVLIFRRSSLPNPSLPTADVTYNFATGAVTGLNSSWFASPPAGTDPLFVSSASASGTGATDVIAAGEWAGAVLFVQNGADGDTGATGAPGLNNATVYLFQRNNTGAAPALPTDTLTYTHSTALLSGGSLNNWSQTVPPASSGKYLFVTTATALSTSGSDTIGAGEWATVQIMAEIGTNARVLKLSSTSQVFQVNKAGASAPTSIGFTATGQALAGSPSFSIVSGTATLAGSGSTRTLAYADMVTDLAMVRVTWDGLIDDITVVKVREGNDALVGFLTNESHVVPTAANGTGGDYSTATGVFKLFKGSVDVSGSSTFSVVSSSNVNTPAINSGGVYSMAYTIADLATMTLRATFGGQSVDKVFTVTRAKAGSNGSNGTNGADGAEGQGLFTMNLGAGMSYANGVLTKVSGSTGWDAHGYSSESYANSAFVSFQPVNTTSAVMVALNQDPTTDSSYVSLDYAWYLTSDGTAQIYENSNGILGGVAYNTASVFSILSDGEKVRYYHNGILIYTSLVSPSGKRFFFDSSFAFGAVRNIRFAPSGNVGQAAISSSLTNAAFNLPAYSDGVVQSYAGAVTTLNVLEGVNNVNGSWSFSKVDSSGVTSSLSGSTVTVTSMLTTTDSGYVDVTATRSGFPTQTKRFSLGKNKSTEPSSGPVIPPQGFGTSASYLFPSGSYTVRAQIELRTDGSIWRNNLGNSGPGQGSAKIGNWYNPATTGIGSGYSISIGSGAVTGPNGVFSKSANGAITATKSMTLSYTGSSSNFECNATVGYTVTKISDGSPAGSGTVNLTIISEV